MKNKLFHYGLPHPFGRRIHSRGQNNISELIRQQLERTEVELETILRWEDDGGLIIQTSFALDNAPVHVGYSHTSL